MGQETHQRRRQHAPARLPVDLGLRNLIEQAGAFEQDRAEPGRGSISLAGHDADDA
jgi:hypothetical protein